ncbi:diacylglycerol kinase [Pseudoduganella sp. GCM10020061]|uniref:diacylglycerol kinase n=1 Tax=Pseudoduganella sp. GCM10020061 TaxID=3317345 RepID=UPI00363A4969
MDEPVSEFKSKSGLRRVLDAFGYSVEGVKAAWRHEFAFRQEIVVVVFATLVALALPVSAFQKLMMIVVLLLVLMVELVNSAIEAVVDRVSLERHPLSKRAKDLGSAAVAMAIIIAALTWGTILFTRFY